MQTLVESKRLLAKVYCPICTHLVELVVEEVPTRYGEKLAPVAGQRCQRCSTSIGSASIVEVLGPAPDSYSVGSVPAQPPREMESAPAAIVDAAQPRRGRARQ